MAPLRHGVWRRRDVWNRNKSSSCRHGPLVRETVGPQDGKSELEQSGKLFVGGLDYGVTDSRVAWSSEVVSSFGCGYELNVDVPNESLWPCKMEQPAPCLSWTHSVPVGVPHCVSVCASGSAIECDIVKLIGTLFHVHSLYNHFHFVNSLQ